MCRGYVNESTTSNTSLRRHVCLDSTTTFASQRIAAKIEIIAEGGIASNTRVYGRSVRGKHILHRIGDNEGDVVSIESSTTEVRLGKLFFFLFSSFLFFSSSQKIIRYAQIRGTVCESTIRENVSLGTELNSRDLRSSL